MKRFISLILALAMACTLAACSSGGDSSASEAAGSAAPAASSSAAAPASSAVAGDGLFNAEGMPIVNEPVTLSIWGSEIVDNDYDTNVTTTAYEEMTGVHIDWQLYSSSQDGNTAFNLMLASQEYPDIISSSHSTDRINMCVEGNVIIPLDELIEKYGAYYKKVLEEQPQYRDMLTAPDGHIYSFMYTDSGVHKDSEYKMWVYQEWLDKLNIEMPTTPEEFKAMLVAFKEQDPNGNGIADEFPLTGFFTNVDDSRRCDPIIFLMNPFELYTNNYFHITDDKKIEFVANTDGWRDGIRYVADLYASGLIPEETYVQDKTQFKSILNCPKEDTVIGSFAYWYQGDAIDINIRNWTDYVPVPPLTGPTGLQQSAARKGGNFNLNGLITSQCEHPEIAFRWLDWMLGEDGLIFGHYGVEGKTYDWVDVPSYEGASPSIVKHDMDKPFDRLIWNSGTCPRYDKASVRYATSYNEELKNVDNTYVLRSAAAVYEPFYVWHNIPDIVWSNDADLSTQISEYRSLINDFVITSYTSFILGNSDINDDAQWENYVKQLNDLGLEQYLECLAAYYLS